MPSTAQRPPPTSEADLWHRQLEETKAIEPRAGRAPLTTTPPPVRGMRRREFLRVSFWGGIGVSLVGAVGLVADYLWPRNVRGFGGPVPAGNVADYPPGAEPIRNRAGQFWIANLDPDDTADNGTGGAAGLLALWHRCPHLGCAVPWGPRARLKEEISPAIGWYQCPCHGSTYTRAGVLFHGPASRSMDTMLIEVDDAGDIIVQTGERTPGGIDNPRRTVRHPLLPS